MKKSEFDAMVAKAIKRSGGSHVPLAEAMAQAHKQSRYKRDGKEHTVKGIPGHAIVYCFDELPKPDDLADDGYVEGFYYRNKGVAVAQITALDGYEGFSKDERYTIQSIELTFDDLYARAKKNISLYASANKRLVNVALSSMSELVQATGDTLMDIALGVLSYGEGVKENKAKTMREAIDTAFATTRW